MKKMFSLLFLIASCSASAYAQYPTTNLNLKKPTRAVVNGDSYVNGDFDILDAPLSGKQTFNPSVAGGARNQETNPWIDVSLYGARAVSKVPQSTVTCIPGSASVTLAAASKFQNGDGVVAYGCGATNTLSTPGAPAVTPSLLSGPDTTVDVVNAPSGGKTIYTYEIVARDKNGALTAAGIAGTTSTGWTLGTQQANVTSLSRSNNSVTVTTSVANGAAVGGIVFITNSNDATFSGFFVIASVASTTQFSYTQGMDTRAGASTTATGGTERVYNCNHLSWAAVSGAWQYYIYGRTGNSLALIGATLPGVTQFNDCGATLSAPPTLPDFVPSTAPASATNDYLATTIVSGAGTTTLTLATAAINGVSGETFKFDDGPTLLNATTAANSSGTTLHIPAQAPGTFYPVNSHTILAKTSGMVLIQSGQLTLNETIEAGSINWSGKLGGVSCSSPQFSWSCGQQINVNAAYPGIAFLNGSAVDYMTFNIRAQGIGVTVTGGQGFSSNFEHDSFNLPNSDQMGQALVGLSMSNSVLRYDLFETNDSSGYGYSLTPLVLLRNDVANVNGPGNFSCEHCYFVGRGFGIDSSPLSGSQAHYRFEDAYAQALQTPLIEVGHFNAPTVSVKGFTNDTSYTAALANWGTNQLVANLSDVSITNSIVTGNLITGLTLNNTTAPGQNRDAFYSQEGTLSIPIYSSTPSTNTASLSADYFMTAPLHFPSKHTLFWDLPIPTDLTATVVTGGSLKPATNTYQVTAVGVDNGETAPTPPATCITTSGNQTCSLSWTAVTGAVSYNVYWDGVTKKAVHVAINSYSDTTNGCCNGAPPNGTGTGLTTIEQRQIITPSLVLSSPLAGAISHTMTFAGPSLTANRVLSGADGAASVVVSASLVTRAAPSDKVTIQGATALSHCSLTPTDRTAATNVATTFISAKMENQIIVTHSATANMSYDVMCTVN
jgi:hypothetical protein